MPGHGVGIGDGLADALGKGLVEALGEGVGEGLGEALGEGLGVPGVGVAHGCGLAVVVDGRTAIVDGPWLAK